jgi:hypothetical protein
MFPKCSHGVPTKFPKRSQSSQKHSRRVPQIVPKEFPIMKRKQGQKRHSYLITFLVALEQRFWARREASPKCKKQRLRCCLDPIILVVVGVHAAIERGADHHHDGSGEDSAGGRHEGVPAAEERCAHHAVPAHAEADCGGQGGDGGPHESVHVFVDGSLLCSRGQRQARGV